MAKIPSRRECIQEFLRIASGGRGGTGEEAGEIVRAFDSRKRLERVLRRYGVPFSSVVKSDIDRVLRPERPKYFARKSRLERLFRGRRAIPRPRNHPKIKTREGMVSISDAARRAAERLSREQQVCPYHEEGLACPKQQSAFYDSAVWARRAKAVRAMDQYTCRSCGRGNRELHVHHVQPIYSVHSRKFHRNFDVCRMRSLCKSCHRDVHEGVLKDSGGFYNAPGREEAKAREARQQWRRWHDEFRDCLWCQRFEWEQEPSRTRPQCDSGRQEPAEDAVPSFKI